MNLKAIIMHAFCFIFCLASQASPLSREQITRLLEKNRNPENILTYLTDACSDPKDEIAIFKEKTSKTGIDVLVVYSRTELSNEFNIFLFPGHDESILTGLDFSPAPNYSPETSLISQQLASAGYQDAEYIEQYNHAVHLRQPVNLKNTFTLDIAKSLIRLTQLVSGHHHLVIDKIKTHPKYETLGLATHIVENIVRSFRFRNERCFVSISAFSPYTAKICENLGFAKAMGLLAPEDEPAIFREYEFEWDTTHAIELLPIQGPNS
jgi:hypothetical protein